MSGDDTGAALASGGAADDETTVAVVVVGDAEREKILETTANDPAIGYNKLPRHRPDVSL